LIVVLVILGLTCAVAAPRLAGGVFEREKLRAEVNRLAAVIAHARDRTESARRGHGLALDLAENAWHLWAAARPDEAAPEAPLLSGRLPDGVAFGEVRVAGREPSEARRVELRFAPDGWVDPALITLEAAGVVHSIVVSAPAGRVATFASRVTLDAEGVVAGAP